MRRAALLLPLVVAFAVYANTLDADFVFDDNSQIVENPWVQDLRALPRLVTSPVWAFKTTEPTNYFRPIQMASYNLLWSVGGGSPLPFHLANVLLHVLNTGLLVLLARSVSRNDATASAAGLLFAVHPLNSEAVAWIACVPELAYTSCVLASLLLLLYSWNGGGRRRRWRRAASVACFALGLLAKETAVVAIALVLLAEIWIRPDDGRRRLRRALLVAVPYAVAFGLYLIARLAAMGEVVPFRQANLTAVDAVLNAPWLLLAYLRVMVAPVGLVAFHLFEPVSGLLDPSFLLALPLALLLAVAWLWLASARPDLGFAGGLLLAPLAPVLYVPALGSTVFTERYAYLATAGAAWLIASAVVHLAARFLPRRAREVTVVVVALIGVAGATATVRRNAVWHDDGTLATATLRDEPRALPIWFMLGNWHERHERLVEAREVYREGLQHFPGHPWLEAELVNTAFLTREISADDAVREYRRLDSGGSTEYWMPVYLGNALRRAGDHEAAAREYRRAIEMNPTYKPAHNGLRLTQIAGGRGGSDSPWSFAEPGGSDLLIEAAGHLTAGRLDQAERILEEALRVDPRSHEALLALALVFVERSDDLAAIEYCRRAIELKPDYVDAHQQLGVSAIKAGDPSTAVESLERASSLAPRDKEIYNSLGVAYAAVGDRNAARRAWVRALELDPDFEKARFNLRRLDKLAGD